MKVAFYHLFLFFAFSELIFAMEISESSSAASSRPESSSVQEDRNTNEEKPLLISIKQQEQLIKYYLYEVDKTACDELNTRRRAQRERERRAKKGEFIQIPNLTDRLIAAIKFLSWHHIAPPSLIKYFLTHHDGFKEIIGNDASNYSKAGPKPELSSAQMRALEKKMNEDYHMEKFYETMDEEDEVILKRSIKIRPWQQKELIEFYLSLDPEGDEALKEQRRIKGLKGRYLPRPPLKDSGKAALSFLAKHNIALKQLNKYLLHNYDILREAIGVPDDIDLHHRGGPVKLLTEEAMDEQKAKILEDYEIEKGAANGEICNFYVKIVWNFADIEAHESFRYKLALHFELDGKPQIYNNWSEHYNVAIFKLPAYFGNPTANGHKMRMHILPRNADTTELKYAEFVYEFDKIVKFIRNEEANGIDVEVEPLNLATLYPRHNLRFTFENIGMRRNLMALECGTLNWGENLPSSGEIITRNKFVNKGSVSYTGHVCRGDKYRIQFKTTILMPGDTEQLTTIRSVICEEAPMDFRVLEYVIKMGDNRLFQCKINKVATYKATQNQISQLEGNIQRNAEDEDFQQEPSMITETENFLEPNSNEKNDSKGKNPLKIKIHLKPKIIVEKGQESMQTKSDKNKEKGKKRVTWAESVNEAEERKKQKLGMTEHVPMENAEKFVDPKNSLKIKIRLPSAAKLPEGTNVIIDAADEEEEMEEVLQQKIAKKRRTVRPAGMGMGQSWRGAVNSVSPSVQLFPMPATSSGLSELGKRRRTDREKR